MLAANAAGKLRRSCTRSWAHRNSVYDHHLAVGQQGHIREAARAGHILQRCRQGLRDWLGAARCMLLAAVPGHVWLRCIVRTGRLQGHHGLQKGLKRDKAGITAAGRWMRVK